MGLLGDVRYVGSGIGELRIDYGPGYRVYFTRRRQGLAIKRHQDREGNGSRALDMKHCNYDRSLTTMSLKTTPYDPAKYLDTEEAIAIFLTDAFDSGHDGVFQNALQVAARARGMSEVARTAGVGRESLYKALQGEAQPRFSTVRKVLAALGVELAIVARKKSPAKKLPSSRRTKVGPAGAVTARKTASRPAKAKALS